METKGKFQSRIKDSLVVLVINLVYLWVLLKEVIEFPFKVIRAKRNLKKYGYKRIKITNKTEQGIK